MIPEAQLQQWRHHVARYTHLVALPPPHPAPPPVSRS